MAELYDRIGLTYAQRRRPDPGIAAAIAEDLETGAWHRRHGHILELDELDLGYRLVIADGP